MTNAWKQQEGQIVDGRYRLVLYLGGSDHSAVFLTELPNTRERAAIKLIGSDPAETDSQLARLRRAAKLSHPHLARILEIGQAQIGSAHVVYLVTDYAEEDLSLILPDRALSPEEVREMLPLIVDTLQYLHSHGFAHARMKPSNIQAVNDQLKLSIDGVCAPHERGSSGEKSSPYDPPELAPTGPSPAGDVWSLGMTIVEVLTQRLPIWEWTGHADPPAPRTLPAAFSRNRAQLLAPRSRHALHAAGNLGKSRTSTGSTARIGPHCSDKHSANLEDHFLSSCIVPTRTRARDESASAEIELAFHCASSRIRAGSRGRHRHPAIFSPLRQVDRIRTFIRQCRRTRHCKNRRPENRSSVAARNSTGVSASRTTAV